jgi:LPXTG-motif cell wall-anchored protein
MTTARTIGNSSTTANTRTYDAITVTSTDPNATIIDKNVSIPMKNDNKDYKAVTYDSDTKYVSIGENVNFTVQFVTVNYVDTTTPVTQYVVEDTPSDMKIDPATVVVKIGNVNKTANNTPSTADTKDDDDNVTSTTYTYPDYNIVYETSTGKMTITIDWTTTTNNKTVSKYAEGSDVVITYNAEVLSAATDGTASNTAVIKYNNTKLKDSETTVNLETKSIRIEKVDPDGNKLTGAVFTLKDQNGTVIYLQKDSDGVYRKADSTDVKNNSDYGNTFTVGTGESNKGVAVIYGLDLDLYYTITEETAPSGYNKLSSDVRVLRNNEVDTDGKAITDDDGNITADPKVTVANFETLTVTNVKGNTLPTTGGMGTTIFYVAGGILVVAALVVLITKKRMDAQN